ncbi:hypothetical protein OAV88_00690 [bacterium]|nr:hypothetical protein [bacterium]
MWFIIAIGAMIFCMLTLGLGMATGRAEPRFVGMIHKASDLRYFRNITVTESLKYGRTQADWVRI